MVICPTDVDPDDERSYYRVSDRIARETPGAWKPDQYANPANPEAHYLTTGPEIWEASEGRVTHFVVALGTGGTISGAGRYLRERNPAVQVVGADPAGSVFSGADPQPYLTEGIGEDFWPATYDTDACDLIVRVSDRDAMLTARQATAAEGILMGESCGTALWAALQVARDAGRSGSPVRGDPAGRRSQLRGQALQRQWLRDNGLLAERESAADYDWRATPRWGRRQAGLATRLRAAPAGGPQTKVKRERGSGVVAADPAVEGLEHAGGIALPHPCVERVEGRDLVAVRRWREHEHLAEQHRWLFAGPGIGKDDVFERHQL